MDETLAIGRRFGEAARAGDVYALVGDLGAGKTQFVKGFVAAIGSPAEVTSPTFTLIHEYEGGRLPVYHFDFYRVESRGEALRLDLDDYLSADGVAVIEWADRFADLLPNRAHWIEIRARNETERLIEARIPA
ncbi:MAG: tRNA (adenosine(37)-N6)-threonylcarbamoyltransferase complex ATPase subunit type 1 TsaE [Chthoniobacterales bacterium]